jgi:hypothetical protein
MSDIAAAAMAEIRERERKFRADLCDPAVTEINLPRAFFHEQIGLRTIMVDPIGRLWDVGASPIKMIFDPFSLSRKTT